MSAIMIMLLVLVAWFFWQSGMAFLAFLAAIVAVLLALMPSQKSGGGAAAAGGAGGYPGPVTMGGTQIPPVMKIKIKPFWGDTTNLEDYAEGLGYGINMVGRTIAWVLRGFKGPGK